MFVKTKTTRVVTSLLSLAVLMPSVALAEFNPNKLIDDRVFNDTQTFGGSQGIQQFLVSKNSVLADTSTGFLLQLREPQDTAVKTTLSDPQPNLGRLRTAAELIWDASVKTGINPQVILVTLQKEQSLITKNFTDNADLQRALNRAMGFGCPDSGGCEALFAGFYYQLFGNLDAQGEKYLGAPGSLMRSFTTVNGRGPNVDASNQTFGSPTVRTSRIGDSITVTNTLGGGQNPQPTQTVTLTNSATAALYRYTPHAYNGNYNFWRFFDSWFRYPNGTLLKLPSDNQIYIINNGLKSPIANFVIAARGLNAGAVITVSPNEFASYDTGVAYGPADNTVIRVEGEAAGKLYVFQNNTRHPVSAFVLGQRGLNAASAINVSAAEAAIFPEGTLLTPNEGTLVQGNASKTVYLIQNSKRMVMTGFTFGQYGFSFKKVVVLPQEEVDSYALGGFLLPKNGTLVRISGDTTVYLLSDSLLHPISGTVFGLHKYSFRNVIVLNGGELAGASIGNFVAPPNNTYFTADGGNNYFLYNNGTKHPMSDFVFRQRNIKRVAVKLSAGEAAMLPDGAALPPRDGTLIKGSIDPTIFVITKGRTVPLDSKTWSVKYRKQKPNILPQAEVDGYLSQLSDTIQQ